MVYGCPAPFAISRPPGPVGWTLPGVLALLLAVPVHGQQAPDDEVFQIANEYFATTAVYPQERAELQLTLLPMVVSFDGGSATDVGVALEYGITDRWQVEAEWSPWVRISPDDADARTGVGTLEIEARRAFMALAGGGLHISLGLEVGIPVGNVDDGFSDGFLEIEPSVVVARDFDVGAPAQVFAQASFGFVERVRDPTDTSDAEPEAHEFGLAVGGAVALGVPRLVLELSGGSNRWNNDGEERELYLTPGVVFVLPGEWEIGIGASIGLVDESDGTTRFAAFLIREF
jgi:hypothetical protein